MSLSSLYSNLNYYNSQVSYWQTSASQYSAQIATLDGEIADREAQRRAGIEIARESFAAIRERVQGVQVSAPFGNVDTALAVLR